MREKELLLKLVTTGHLNVPERKELPQGQVRASIAKELIYEMLHIGWFPGNKQKPVGNAGGEYLQLETAPGGKIILHRNTEASLYKFSHETKEFASTESGIEAFLKGSEERDLDGLKINWKS